MKGFSVIPAGPRRPLRALALLLLLGACGQIALGPRLRAPAPPAPCKGDCPVVQVPDADTPRPRYRTGTPPPPAGRGFVEGISAEKLDTTTAQEKSAALADARGAEKRLGSTVAGLGDVSEQGFWLKTPLVLAETKGRVVWEDSGESINLTLMPKPGAPGSASQISLAAMRALGIPLTALAKLAVYAGAGG